MAFNVAGELLSSKYLKESDIIDDYIGNTLWLWGQNSYGQLGNSTTTAQSTPNQTSSGGNNWKQVIAGKVSGGIKTDGTLWLWGSNVYGQLGDNTNTNRSNPAQTVAAGTNWKQVSGTESHVAAIKTDGTLWTWGQNTYGQLGDNTRTNKYSPIQTVSAGNSWKQVCCAGYHTVALKTDGTLWTWGANFYGVLGTNDTNNRSSPVQTVAGGTNWRTISAADISTTAGIKTDGTLWIWGYGVTGMLGDNTTVSKSSPIQTIAGGTNWRSIACGYPQTAAIKTDGTLWVWGYNGSGGLGDGTTTNASSPIQTISAGNNWKQVTCGMQSMAAIKTDGTLWGWGYNQFNLGDGTVTSRSSPVQTVAGGSNWKYVVMSGASTTAAITFSDFN